MIQSGVFCDEKKLQAFTLIELSIVVVVISLIVAGIVSGQTLVRQSQIRSITSDFNKYKAAFETFYLTYSAYPGDIKNVIDYWPSVFNGNGDKFLSPWDGTVYQTNGTASTSSEAAMASAHLSYAGLISGEFSTTSANPVTDSVTIPSNIAQDAGYLFTSGVHRAGFGSVPRRNCGYATIVLRLGNPLVLSGNTHNRYPLLSTGEVINIENKYDDGLPEKGVYIGCNGEGADGGDTGYCINASGDPFVYDTTDLESIYCSLSYKIR